MQDWLSFGFAKTSLIVFWSKILKVRIDYWKIHVLSAVFDDCIGEPNQVTGYCGSSTLSAQPVQKFAWCRQWCHFESIGNHKVWKLNGAKAVPKVAISLHETNGTADMKSWTSAQMDRNSLSIGIPGGMHGKGRGDQPQLAKTRKKKLGGLRREKSGRQEPSCGAIPTFRVPSLTGHCLERSGKPARCVLSAGLGFSMPRASLDLGSKKTRLVRTCLQIDSTS